MSQEQALAEAEAFIRRAVNRTSGGKIAEAKIKEAARKVVAALPPEAVAA